MSRICSFEDCERVVFQDRQECVLHCDKNKSFTMLGSSIKNYWAFHDALIEYIASSLNNKFISSLFREDVDYKTLILKYLNGSRSGGVQNIIAGKIVEIEKIFFPEIDNDMAYDFVKILSKLEKVHFMDCKFLTSKLFLSGTQVFYQNCHFFNNFRITPTKLLENVTGAIFCKCEFEKIVELSLESNSEFIIDIPLFSGCQFFDSLELESATIRNHVLDKSTVIPKLIIKDSIFENNFILNSFCIDRICVEDTKFLSKVEIQNCSLTEAKFIDSEFKSSFDAYGTKFGKFFAATTIFSDFAGFERCEFGKTGDENGVAQFEYVTFLSFANIRNTIFHQGLNLEDTNLKEAPNFLNIQLLSDNTNRETYRIIKHSFDKIGNHIEANRFYAKEMDKYQQSLKDKPISQEKIIFWLNKYSSNFGQSYLLPIFWIAVFTGIYYLIIQGYESETLYSFYLPWNEKINFFATKLNDVASNVIPFKNLMKESKGYEFITLIFYVILASLIWQTIVALKRYTQR